MTLLVHCKISLFLLAIGCWPLVITCALSTFSTPETKTIKTTGSGKQRPRTEWHHCHTGCQNETHSHHVVGLGRVSDCPACSFSVMLMVPTDREGTRSLTERTSLAVGPCPFFVVLWSTLGAAYQSLSKGRMGFLLDADIYVSRRITSTWNSECATANLQ